MTDSNIKQRASDKAFAKLVQIKRNIADTQKDINLGRYGGVTKEEFELCLNQEIKDQKVWEYITFLIEKDNK